MSLRNEIIDYLKNFPEGVKLASIRGAIKRPPQQITSALWKMKKSGEVSHNNVTHLYGLLTDVNKTQEQVAPKQKPSHSEAVKEGMAKTISKLNTQIADYKKTLDRADTVYEELANRYKVLQSTHNQIQEAHADALAVIRYLEDKLFIAIQSNARNGNS